MTCARAPLFGVQSDWSRTRPVTIEQLIVAMDEAGVGPGAAALRKADEGRMHRGHEMWLATLKWVAEGR